MGVAGRFSSVHRSFGRSEFTVYVDNLPNSCGTPWFRLVFSQYGFIDETFLPNKRSKRTGNRFGFVRYRNRRDATSAVAMANGLRFGSRSIIVEMARYDSGLMWGDSTRFGSGSQNHEFSRVPNAKIPHIQDDFRAPRGKPKSIPVPQHHFHTESSQIPNMGNLKELERKVTLNLQPTASGWLMTSAVAKLKQITTMEIVQQALEDLDFQDVSAKSLGGMDLIITFQSKEDRQAALRNPKIQGWFKSFKPWNGEPSGKSRLVWLKCRGIPLNVWSLSSFKRIGEIWGEFITLDQETLKEESYDVGRMMIASEHLNRIDEWINITVRGRNYSARIWEEDCDDPFNEKHIRDWINNHISIPVTIPKSREDVTGWDGDLAEKIALDKPNLAELEAKSADKAVSEGNLTSKDDIIFANAAAQEVEESIVGESLANNNQPLGNKEQQADLEEIPVNHTEVMHNQCVTSKPYAQLVLQNVTNVAAAGDMLSSSYGVKKSAMGSGKVRGSVGERNVNTFFQNISLAPLTIIELHRNMQFPKAKLSNLVDDQVSWVANSVSEKLPSTETSREEYDEDEPLLDQNEDNHIEEEPILAPIKAAINGVKGKKKRKTIDDILGFTKVNPANNKGRKNKQKCEVYRSAVAALALSASISSEGFVNRNRILLNEAQAVWACNKITGLGYDGDEDEVVSKIAEMEAQDLDRADGAKICI